LKLEFKRKQFLLVWKEGSSYYSINRIGEVIEEAASQPASSTLPMIENLGSLRLQNNVINGEGDTIAYVDDLSNT